MSGRTNPGSGVKDKFEAARQEMVARQLRARGISSQRVLEAMATVPRHLFVSTEQLASAYADEPLSIGSGQTISQPFMVAAMSEALSLRGSERVLEVGAGSGYQAAILSLLARDVTAVEAQPSLASQARERLSRLGYRNVRVEVGDGSLGWPALSSLTGPHAALYDAILVAAAAPAVPPPLVEQLAEGGRLVIPVGKSDHQELLRIVKRDASTTQESLYACRFVPLLGHYGWHPMTQGSRQE
jgi:protein-L-isoaspartate(D-aspartate) O-methyltransferase